MTPDQTRQVKQTATALKQVLLDFTGSVKFNLSPTKDDVKIEVIEHLIKKSK